MLSGRSPAASVGGTPFVPCDEGRAPQGWLQSTEPRDSQGGCSLRRIMSVGTVCLLAADAVFCKHGSYGGMEIPE